MFKEGEWYSFSIIRIIDVPGNGKHYVLAHESGRKLLLPAEYYVKYNIAENTTIRCRVDKINCTGQIFIEPEHPVYKIGNTYHFKVKQISGMLIDGVESLMVIDVFGNPVETFISKGSVSPGQESVDLKVIGIKKGVPMLASLHQWLSCEESFERNQIIELLLQNTLTIQGDEYFVFKTQLGCLAMLKAKHFKHYGFENGNRVVARFRGFDQRGFILVDPEHPYYKKGEIYSFEITGFEDDYSAEFGTGKVAVVYDRYGMKCGVRIENFKNYSIGDTVNCRVSGYKKGRPLLEIAPD